MLKKMLKSGGNTQKQTFSFSAPGALSVQLVGDFTQWEERPINLQKGLDGVWWVVIGLKPGTHHYRFLVDGQGLDQRLLVLIRCLTNVSERSVPLCVFSPSVSG